MFSSTQEMSLVSKKFSKTQITLLIEELQIL